MTEEKNSVVSGKGRLRIARRACELNKTDAWQAATASDTAAATQGDSDIPCLRA